MKTAESLVATGLRLRKIPLARLAGRAERDPDSLQRPLVPRARGSRAAALSLVGATHRRAAALSAVAAVGGTVAALAGVSATVAGAVGATAVLAAPLRDAGFVAQLELFVRSALLE